MNLNFFKFIQSIMSLSILVILSSCIDQQSLEEGKFDLSGYANKDITTPISVIINKSLGQADPTNSLPASFTITFSREIDPTSFTLVDIIQSGTATVDNWILTPLGDNKTFTLTATAVSVDGTIIPTIAAGSIQDTNEIFNSISTTSSDNSVSYDLTDPNLISILRQTGEDENTNSTSVIFTVTFDEAVSGVDDTDFVVTSTLTATGSVVLGGITQISPTVYRVVVSGVSGDGTLRLDLDNATITDVVGNSLVANTINGDESFIIDNTKPELVSIVPKVGETNPTSATSVIYTATFNEAVNASSVNTSDFVLTTVGTAGTVSGVSTVSSTVYEITVSSVTGTGSIRLDLDASDIVDLAGNTLLLTSANGDDEYDIDNTAPYLVNIVRKTPTNPTNAASVVYTVTFSEDVTGVDIGVGTSDFTLTTVSGDATGSIASILANSGSEYEITVDTIAGDGELRLDLSDGDTDIEDAVGNTLADTSVVGDESFLIDNTAPFLVEIVRKSATNPTNATSVIYTATFSEDVTGADVGVDFEVVAPGAPGETATGTIASIDQISGSEYDITVDTISGDGELRLDLKTSDAVDAAGNALVTTSVNGDETFTIDNTAPSLVSIVRKSATNPTNDASVIYTVTFSEDVTGVDVDLGTSDFTLTTVSGDATGSIASIDEISASEYEITVDTIAGDGELRLDLSDGDTDIEDALGHILVANAADGDETFIIDNTQPSLVSIVRKSGSNNPTSLTSILFTVTFDEDVTNVATSDFALALTDTANGSITGITEISPDVYDVTVSSVVGNGTLGLDLNDSNNSLTDLAGNTLSSTSETGEIYTVSKITSIVLTVTGSTSIPANTLSTTTIEATAYDEDSNVVVGENLTLNIPTDGGSTSNPQTTNGSGVAQWTLSSSLVVGTYNYDASFGVIDSNSESVDFTVLTPFITVWETTNPGTSNNDQITLPLVSSGTYNFNVDWGDGSPVQTITTWNDPNATHTFLDGSGTKTVTMTGVFTAFVFNGGGDAQKLTLIDQWGDNPWSIMNYAFSGCSNLEISVTAGAPDLSNVTSIRGMFLNASIFNTNISSWDTSTITSMAQLFEGASLFNQPLDTNWDMSNVTEIQAMFKDAIAFNQDISGWSTNNVTNMNSLFSGASTFNQDIRAWNTSNVTGMSEMFFNASVFNQSLNSVTWDTSNVTSMFRMFRGANAFNGDVTNFNTANVSDMSEMFYGLPLFNQNISGWNTSNVIDMSQMFSQSPVFDQPIGNWDTTKVTSMNHMFYEADAFNQSLNWNTANVINMHYMFYYADAFNGIFAGDWNTTNVANMNAMFGGALAFNQDIGNWDVSNVTNMGAMFYDASSFNQNLNLWDTSNVTSMMVMFAGASAFNGDITTWNTANVTTMLAMFEYSSAFDQNISGWNTANVTNMNTMFFFATSFNQDLSGWDVTNVTTYTDFDGNATSWVLPKPSF